MAESTAAPAPAFTVTEEVIHSIFDPTSAGDWAPFLAAIDEDVHWVINDTVSNPRSLTGVYNLARWMKDVNQVLFPKLEDKPYCMTIGEYHILSPLKVVLEARGEATQKNGNPYNNKFAWFLVFSGETGKIVEIREYMNTALVQEVNETNP